MLVVVVAVAVVVAGVITVPCGDFGTDSPPYPPRALPRAPSSATATAPCDCRGDRRPSVPTGINRHLPCRGGFETRPTAGCAPDWPKSADQAVNAYALRAPAAGIPFFTTRTRRTLDRCERRPHFICICFSIWATIFCISAMISL